MRQSFTMVWLMTRVTATVTLLAATTAVAQVAQDVVSVGTGTGGPSQVVDVPVFIRDTSGTPLGVDQPPGSRIQSYGIRVNYAPAAAVQSVTFSRAGITAPLTPSFEASPSSAGSISLFDTFAESTNLIPFTLNAAAPGNQVAHLLVTISAAATPGVISLTLDPTLTQLTDQAGSPATREIQSAGTLSLVSGSITVVAPAMAEVPTLPAWALVLLAMSLSVYGARLRLSTTR